MNAVPITAEQLAQRFDLQLQGEGTVVVHGVAPLASAGPGQLAFLANPHYRPQLAQTRASVVVLNPAEAQEHAGTVLVARDPYAAFAKISALFEPLPVREPGIHPSAVIDSTATVAPDAHVGAFVSIGPRSRIGAGCIVGAGCIIGEDCEVGAGTELIARVTLVTRVRIGQRCRIHPGAVLGATGFGLAMEGGRWLNVPQLGGVVVGDDCDIGANTTIDRGALEDTTLEEDVRLDNQIQIAHNVHVGAHTAMAAQVGIAGSARIGRYCLLAGKVGVAGHLQICDRVTVTAMSMVTGSIREPGEYSSSIPVSDSRSWRRNAARFRQLDSLARRILAADKDSKR